MERQRFYCVVAGLGILLTAPFGLAEQSPSLEALGELRHFDRPPTKAQMTLVRQKFPLSDERIQRFLRQVIQKPLLPEYDRGLRLILYSHGSEGFMWALCQMGRATDVNTRTNLLWALKDHEYREVYVLCICLLGDQRVVPWPKGLFDKLQEGLPPPRPGQGPDSVCDMAVSAFCMKLELRRELPEELNAGGIWKSVLQKDREKSVELLKTWWAKEGERMITATRPSIVEVLLKEADEKAKKEAEEKARKDSEPKPKEPPKPEGEKKEPEKK